MKTVDKRKKRLPAKSTSENAQQQLVQLASANLPSTHREKIVTSFHGVELFDDYAWLRADNWKDVLQDGSALPAHIRKQLERENRYTSRVLKNADRLIHDITLEMKGRIKENDDSIPLPAGSYEYFTRFETGEEHPVFCRRSKDGKDPEVLLDGNHVALKHKFCDIGAAIHSPDHKLVAWSCDTEGSEFYTIRIRSAKTGWDKRERIEMTDGSMVWAKDSRSFYYVKIDENHRPRSVRRHWVNGSVQDDELVYRESDEEFFVDLSQSQSGDFAFINVGGHDSSQEWLLDLADDYVKARLITARRNNILYESGQEGKRLFIKTNADGAKDFKIVTAPLDDPSAQNWTDYIAHKPGVMILSMLVLKDYLVRLERESGTRRLIVHRLSDKSEHSVTFDGDVFDLDLIDGFEFDTDTIHFVYSSMAHPEEFYAYNLATRDRALLKRREIPSGHDAKNYVVKRVLAKAMDGEIVPVSLMHRYDLQLDGKAPCLLYAYGAYGSSSPPLFESEPLSMVDRGFVYAIAHVRGGTEKGWSWYEQGKLLHKKNTFTDYITVAKHLCNEGYTSEGMIVAQGVSAGGMLMGAVANMAPELFAAVIAEVPFVDVLNTILDAELPLTPPEWPEWGNPVTDKAAFDYILSYSPYDNITPQDYPAILAIGGLTDPRVTYWEPAKWISKLRAEMTGGGPVLLHSNLKAGHSGSSGRFERLDDIAMTYAFAIAAVNSKRLKNGI